MAYEFKHTRQVEFFETDTAGIMHFSNFFRYMEITEHSFFRSLGLSVHTDQGNGKVIGWPRIQASCDYKAPLRFEDNVEIQLLVTEKNKKVLGYTFIFRKQQDDEWIEVARGNLKVVCAMLDDITQTMKSVSMPKAFDETIEVVPSEML